MIRTLSACLLAAAACLAPAAHGGVIYERSLTVDRSVNIFTTSAFDLEFVFGDAFFSPSNPVKLFHGVSLSPASVGNVYQSALGDAEFANIAQRITDGRDEFIRLLLVESASGRKEQRGWQESGFFLGHGSTLDPDLAGAVVQGVQLRIDEFLLLPQSRLAVTVPGPQMLVSMTFTVLGETIPEPSTLALGAAGLAAMVGAVYTSGNRRRPRA